MDLKQFAHEMESLSIKDSKTGEILGVCLVMPSIYKRDTVKVFCCDDHGYDEAYDVRLPKDGRQIPAQRPGQRWWQRNRYFVCDFNGNPVVFSSGKRQVVIKPAAA